MITRIEAKRQHLMQYPASCSARIAREETWAELYALTESEWGWTRAQTDQQYRTLDDYVFAELIYEQSRTCCWNSSTAEMYTVIMDFNQKRVLDEETQTCNEPLVFKMVDGGYEAFAEHAAAVGATWVGWSADESCPQADSVLTDTEVEHGWTAYCELQSMATPNP